MIDRNSKFALELTVKVSLLILGSNFGASRWSQPNQPAFCTLKQPRAATVILSIPFSMIRTSLALNIFNFGRIVKDHGEFLKNDYKQWLKEKTSIIEQWARAGKMDPIDPHHLMFMIWGSTQFYADFSVQVESGLNMKSLDDLQYENIAKTITQVILKGCGIK